MNDTTWTKAATALSIIIGIIFSIIFLIHLKSLGTGILSPAELVIVRTLQPVSGAFMPTKRREWAIEFLTPLLRPKLLRKRDAADVSAENSTERSPIWKMVLVRTFKFIIHFALIYLVGPIVAITSVERMIRANHLKTDGIRNSTGQMIALFTGISSILLAVWDLVKVVLKLEPRQEED